MIILASQSASRAAMLRAAGVAFEAAPAHVDEEGVTEALVAAGASADHLADALAELKAIKVSRSRPTALVLGSDSVVTTADGRFLAKPETRVGAEAQLRDLSGTKHRLTSAAVIAQGGVAVWRAVDHADLTMRPLGAAFIADYLDQEGDAVLGCVGTYRLEGLGAQLFTHIVGDQFVIRGLPLLAVLDFLRGRGEMMV